MKKNIFILLILLTIPVLVHPVSPEGVIIKNLSMKPVPFNERRDPQSDSPYNAFDGDLKSAALYSDFTVEFETPVSIDQIKIMNGNTSSKDVFMKSNRERDVEITLYAVAIKSNKNETEKEKPKIKKKKETKKDTGKEKNIKVKESKEKNQPEINEKNKKENKEKEIKKSGTPEKVVNADEYETSDDYIQNNVMLYLTASETVSDPVEKTVLTPEKETKKATGKTDKNKATPKKKSDEIKKTSKKKNAKKVSDKKVVKESVSDTASGGNIIEITDSKKNKSAADTEKKDKAAESVQKAETLKNQAVKVETIKPITGTEKVPDIEQDNPIEKLPIPEIKKDKIKKLEPAKKVQVKADEKKKVITEKEKKPISADKKLSKKKATKPESKMNKNFGVTDKKITDKREELKKEGKSTGTPDKPDENVTVNKMTGIVKIEGDSEGRVFVYASLKDSMDFQSLDLKGEYTVTKIGFRTKDDEYYSGTESDRSGITEIALFNKGKIISFQGIENLKKTYKDRYNKYLTDSISGETFVMLDNNEIVMRMTFRKDGRMEFHDRFKCSKKGDAECTSTSMPDMWRVTDGKLFMRYHTLWRVWKYELDCQSDMLSAQSEMTEPPRWMKIYYKSDTGFSDKYLDLARSEKGIWTE